LAEIERSVHSPLSPDRRFYGIHVGRETIRKWLTEAGIWLTRAARALRAHQPRHRRQCLGELVQIDGCDHEWFEQRADRCTALVYVDDATGRLMELRFVKSESAFDYFDSTVSYLGRHGKPVAFYSDKHSVFRVNKEGSSGPAGGVERVHSAREPDHGNSCWPSSSLNHLRHFAGDQPRPRSEVSC